MPNRLKTLFEAGNPAIGSWVGFPDLYSVEVMADAGFDFLMVDAEHNPISRDTLRSILVTMKGSISTPVVRVQSNTVDHIQTALDLGAQAVVVPMINSTADAQRAVKAAKYPPAGARGFGPIRASRYFQEAAAYAAAANTDTCLIFQIETPEAAAHFDEIVGVGSVDAIFIGPSDIANFMNLAAQISHPDVVKAVDGVIEKARARKIPYGLPTWTPEECLSYVNRGGQFLTLGGDLHFLSTGARGTLSQMRNLLKA